MLFLLQLCPHIQSCSDHDVTSKKIFSTQWCEQKMICLHWQKLQNSTAVLFFTSCEILNCVNKVFVPMLQSDPKTCTSHTDIFMYFAVFRKECSLHVIENHWADLLESIQSIHFQKLNLKIKYMTTGSGATIN